ncbi:MAG: hypothetical protein IAF38_08665 [Bacteroidia bacterium]|nr:hypothetical protein [Bacteroidia bacterium]
MIRFGFYEETSVKDSSYSFIKIFSRKNSESTKWSAFFSNKTSRKELKKIDVLTRKYLFSKITDAKFVMVPNTTNGNAVFEKKK